MATPKFVANTGLRDLANALGLDGRGIVRIRIDAAITKAVIVEITEIMQVEHHEKACQVIRHYRLEPIEPPSQSESKPVSFREFT